MIFCHEWVQTGDGEMCAVKLSHDLTSAVGEARLLFKASAPDWSDKSKTQGVTDGPFIRRCENGRLLLIWATLVRGVYVEAVAYSDNGRLDGNWIHDTELLFDKNGGHGMIFTSFDGDLYFILHAPNSAPDERPVLIPIVEHDGKLFFRSEDSV